jgi:site-specific DNA-methyltransferase (cytosine-N4-specific)
VEGRDHIEATNTTTGHGAETILVAPTEKLMNEIVEPMLKRLASQTDPRVVALLRQQPLREILSDLDSSDRHVAGLALEALALKLMRLFDMDYVATRLRGAQTGGTEVDLVFQSTRLVFTRWQIQCKNAARMSIDDVARAVGLTHVLKSNAVVVVTTGTVEAEARRYANEVMVDSSLAIVLIGGEDLKVIAGNPTRIVDIFEREARRAMDLKKLEIEGT